MEALGGPGVLDVARPRGPTCFPSNGEPSCADFFLASPALRRLVVGCHVWEGTTIATRLPVVLGVVIAGPVAPLTKGRRPRAPEPEHLCRIIGPLRPVTDHVAELLAGPEWEPSRRRWRRGPPGQVEVDHAWSCWLKSVAGELAEATGRLEKVVEGTTFVSSALCVRPGTQGR